MKKMHAALVFVVVIALSPALAFAHSSINPNFIEKDESSDLRFEIENDEANTPLESVTVTIPRAFSYESASIRQGWKVTPKDDRVIFSGGKLESNTALLFTLVGRATQVGKMSFYLELKFSDGSTELWNDAGTRAAPSVTVIEKKQTSESSTTKEEPKGGLSNLMLAGLVVALGAILAWLAMRVFSKK